ncbi:MAG: hypothetical protein QQW96_15845 [Tychonema bourrellyi B0820]|nr:hypothetical protein [Tychonema bourrellyi B0820]
MLIIKENIFPDGNTGSSLGGKLGRGGNWGDGERGRWGDGEMGRWGDEGEGEMGREGLDFGLERLTKYFYFFLPKSLIFPASTSLTF